MKVVRIIIFLYWSKINKKKVRYKNILLTRTNNVTFILLESLTRLLSTCSPSMSQPNFFSCIYDKCEEIDMIFSISYIGINNNTFGHFE